MQNKYDSIMSRSSQFIQARSRTHTHTRFLQALFLRLPNTVRPRAFSDVSPVSLTYLLTGPAPNGWSIGPHWRISTVDDSLLSPSLGASLISRRQHWFLAQKKNCNFTQHRNHVSYVNILNVKFKFNVNCWFIRIEHWCKSKFNVNHESNINRVDVSSNPI